MVAQERIELPSLGYEPNILPLDYRASKLVRTSRIELETPGWKPGTLPLRHARVILYIWWVMMDSNQLSKRNRFTVCPDSPTSAITLIPYTLSVNPIVQRGKESDIRQRSPSVNLA